MIVDNDRRNRDAVEPIRRLREQIVECGLLTTSVCGGGQRCVGVEAHAEIASGHLPEAVAVRIAKGEDRLFVEGVLNFQRCGCLVGGHAAQRDTRDRHPWQHLPGILVLINDQHAKQRDDENDHPQRCQHRHTYPPGIEGGCIVAGRWITARPFLNRNCTHDDL